MTEIRKAVGGQIKLTNDHVSVKGIKNKPDICLIDNREHEWKKNMVPHKNGTKTSGLFR